MPSINAEYDYFNEFKDFSVTSKYDGIRHYNQIYEADYKSYYTKITELSGKLKLELELNLLYLSDSKTKCWKYLEKINAKLLDLRVKLEEGYEDILIYDAFSDSICEDEFEYKLWWHHWEKLNELIDFCYSEQSKNIATSKSNIGRKANQIDIIPISSITSNQLSKLYFGLIYSTREATPFIEDTTFRQFEAHFRKEAEPVAVNINWVSEKYLLTYLFDSLFKFKLINKEFKSNCDVILSKHFVYKGKKITPSQLSSARDFFNKKKSFTTKSSRKIFSLERIERLVEKIAMIKNESENSDGKIILTRQSAHNRS